MRGRETRRPGRERSLPAPAALVLAVAGLLALSAGCGGRTLAAGTVPFPAEKAVFVDEQGHPLRSLPPSPEPLKLVVLDFPWCPPCAEAWRAVRTVAGALKPGTLRVYRIVFDRERFFTREGVSIVPPLNPAPEEPPGAPSPAFALTTLTAVPDAFRKEYEIEQAPAILLLSSGGNVIRRWTGYSPSLSASLEEEIRRAAAAPAQDSSESPPL